MLPAGRGAKEANLYTEIAEGMNSYGVSKHRHSKWQRSSAALVRHTTFSTVLSRKWFRSRKEQEQAHKVLGKRKMGDMVLGAKATYCTAAAASLADSTFSNYFEVWISGLPFL